jgi:hypothetical protein
LRGDKTERKDEMEGGNLIERQIEKELVSVNISEELLKIECSNTFHLLFVLQLWISESGNRSGALR